ncbi:MAG: bifunctional serine/threonine-protein kinase/formylglycine-generating enzyme family protein, partial [Planctomycetota bacterium]
GVELADGLAHAHEQGIIHRDVKPGNVRITPDGRSLLLDFGLAREMNRETIQLTHAFMGTPAYVAPEQVRGERTDGRTDVYGLGATLFEAITGSPPFEGDDVERVLHATLHETAPTLASKGVRVPASLELVVATALAKAPARRYASVAELRDDLRAILELRPISARLPGPWTRLVDWTRRHRSISVAALAVLSSVTVFVGWETLRSAQALRETRAEAASLVQQASDRLERYHAGRDAYERAKLGLNGIRMERQVRHVTEQELAGLEKARRIVRDYEALRLDVEDVPVLLGRAERLDPEADRIQDVRAGFWYQKWLGVRDEPDQAAAIRYRDFVLAADPTNAWSDLVTGQVELRIESNPPGAEVFLFQMRPHRSAAGERLVPSPLGHEPNRALGDWKPGAMMLEVLEDATPLVSGDWLTFTDPAGLVAGSSVDRLTLAGIESVELVNVPNTRMSGTPLPPTSDAHVGATPLRFPTSDPGYYAALLTLPGYEPMRISFHLDHACEHYSKGLTLTGELLPIGTTPTGFVHVPVGSYGTGERSFWMMRHEVTAHAFAEFLASKQGVHAMRAGELEWPRDAIGAPWPRDDSSGIPARPNEMDPNLPMLGVTVADARAFASWFQSTLPQEEGWEADLPTLGEWRWAAFGGDGREFVYGTEFVPTWTSSRFATETPGPMPVGSFPLDESPWAIYDLAGSAAEWVRDRTTESWALTGGSWNLSSKEDFSNRRVRYPASGMFESGTGFRLVIRRD